jgi:hypothetical protein
MHDCYSFVFLFDDSCSMANYVDLSSMGEVLCSGFNLMMSSPSDRRGSEARICIVAIKNKTTGSIHIG